MNWLSMGGTIERCRGIGHKGPDKVVKQLSCDRSSQAETNQNAGWSDPNATSRLCKRLLRF